MKPFIKLICGEGVDKTLIRPAVKKRKWMEETPNKFAYRCLPLNIANQYGWEFCCPHSFDAVWYGGLDKSEIVIRTDEYDPFVKSHFGSGILTFNVNIVVKTDENHNLMITGPINEGKSLLFPLSGIIESDWMPYTFTMNWKFTEENSAVRFEKGEPFCRIFPVPKNIEEFEISIEDISENLSISEEMEKWALKRDYFNVEQNNGKDWSVKLPGLYYKGTYSDGTCPNTEHKTRLNLSCPINENNVFQGKTFDNILSKEQCNEIIKYAETNINWENAGHEFWNNRVINIQSISDEKIFNILINAKEFIARNIKESYNITKEIYPDIFQIVRWDVGLEQTIHADACNQDGSSNGLTWRHFGSILYLNDDYEGGKTYYEKHNIEITPKTGMLAVHLGDLNHNHGVTKVLGKTRYTLAAFWGFDKTKEFKI